MRVRLKARQLRKLPRGEREVELCVSTRLRQGGRAGVEQKNTFTHPNSTRIERRHAFDHIARIAPTRSMQRSPILSKITQVTLVLYTPEWNQEWNHESLEFKSQIQ